MVVGQVWVDRGLFVYKEDMLIDAQTEGRLGPETDDG